MITNKIKALFQFIEYLHSNIENFNQYEDLINDLMLLGDERKELRPDSNYKDRVRYDEIQAEIKPKFNELQEKTANLISAKVIELNLGNFDGKELFFSNEIADEIHQLKRNFSNEDLTEIFKHKSQYIEFRNNDYCYFLSLFFFFNEVDRITKDLFDFFKDTNQNEFEGFETKEVQVNNFKEAFKLLKQGKPQIININPLNPQQQTNIEPLLPPRLQTNLTIEKRTQLFTELVKGEFIPKESKDCFYWAIGVTNEEKPMQPGQWQLIEWKQAKQLLRELLEAIKSDEIIKAEMERITPALFSSKGKVMEKLPKNKVTETQLHKRLKKIIADILKA